MLKKLLAVLLTAGLMMPVISVQAKSPLVVVIDPGHGGSERGANVKDASGKRVYEKNLNLKMAQAMAHKLKQYAGVKVYMTRKDDSTVTLAKRLSYAKSVGCQLFYSLHVNAKGDAQKETSGISALISKGAYRPKLAQTAKGISDLSLRYVSSASGMTNNGDLYRSSGSRKYANGATADYYYVVRQSTIYNFPGFIIEHGFIDNAHDFAILHNDEKLRKIGEADAQAVIDYYHLKPQSAVNQQQENTDADDQDESEIPDVPNVSVSNTSKGVSLKWRAVDGADHYTVSRKVKSWGNARTVKGTSFTDQKVSNGQKYSYRVVAVNDAGKSGSLTKSIVYLKRNKITGLTRKKHLVTIRWTKNNKASGYRVYYKKGRHTYYSTIRGNKKTSLTKLMKKGSYQFSVRVYQGNTRYWSAFSPWRSIRVK